MFSTYWRPTWAPYPRSHSPLNLIDGCPVQAFHAWLTMSVCVCVCCSQEALRRCGGCRGRRGCSMVPVHLCGAFLWVLFFSHERRVLPHIIFSLSCFLPHYAHNKGHEAHRHTHKFIKSQETRLIWLTARVSSLSRVCNLASPTDLAAIMHRIF